ncbi:MAG: hypothetical protein HQK89_09480 [Nitrospirae bacterium]|nr:hypothetical protein [Nitrospirota bacterium]
MVGTNLAKKTFGDKPIDGDALLVDVKELLWGTKLKNHFTNVIDTPDGEKGYERFTKDFRNWVAVICNWDVKGLSGIKLLQKIRNPDNDYHDVPFIFLIDAGTKEELLHKIFWSLEEGATDVIVKPYSINSVNKKIQDLKSFIVKYYPIRHELKYSESYLRHKKYDQAAQKLGQCKLMESASIFADKILYIEGKLLETDQNNVDAESRYLHCLDVARYHLFAPARASLIELCLNKGDMDKALYHALEAIKISPLNPSWRLYYGKILLIEGKKKEAENVFKQVVNSDSGFRPEIESICNTVDATKKDNGSFTEDDLSRVETIDTATAAAEEYVNTAKTYLKNGHYEDAIKQYSKAAEVDTRSRKKYYAAIGYLNYRWYLENKTMGRAQNSLRPLRDAIGYLLDAAKIDTSFTGAIKLMAKILELEKNEVIQALSEKELLEAELFLKQHRKF